MRAGVALLLPPVVAVGGVAGPDGEAASSAIGGGNPELTVGTKLWILASGLADLPANISDPSSGNILLGQPV
ncbi:hypothetical protein KPH14_008579 [Odynerus spinipes]|uniref:Uncharacterized protein n=1 Tax=Odynerus spinipes TaxID=1348599 RepID=A0AAD9VS98_9HYME|nr:hypothetical protein KPH14_008579 [Odynerus spinipes]